jgi:pilus assembly protein CpaE
LRALRLEDCPLDRTALLVDNYRRRIGLEPENLAEILDLPLLGVLPSASANNRVQAMNAGEPLFTVAPKDDFCEDIQRVAAALLGGQTKAESVPQGLLSRWLN